MEMAPFPNTLMFPNVFSSGVDPGTPPVVCED